MAWQNERGENAGHELLKFRTGDGIAIEQRVAGHGYQGVVGCDPINIDGRHKPVPFVCRNVAPEYGSLGCG
jgi:hypothetical protein